MDKDFILLAVYRTDTVYWDGAQQLISPSGMLKIFFNEGPVSFRKMQVPVTSVEFDEIQSFKQEVVNIAPCRYIIINVGFSVKNDKEAYEKAQQISHASVLLLSLAFGPDLFSGHLVSEIIELEKGKEKARYSVPETTILRKKYEVDLSDNASPWMEIIEKAISNGSDKLISALSYLYETLDINHKIVKPEVILYLLYLGIERLVDYICSTSFPNPNSPMDTEHYERFEKIISKYLNEEEKNFIDLYLKSKKHLLLSVPFTVNLYLILSNLSSDKNEIKEMVDAFKFSQKIRNTLFHGSLVKENDITQAIEKLRSVIYHILLKLLKAPYVVERIVPRYHTVQFKFTSEK